MLNVDSVATSPQELRELTAELRQQPRSLIAALIGAIRPDRRTRQPRVDEDLWGAAPTIADTHRAAAGNLELGVGRRQAVIQSSLTRAQVAERLGRTSQAVSAMLDRGALQGLKEGREWRIPAWQLDPDQVDGVLPGLRPLAQAYRDGIVSLTEWVQRPHPDLDDASPLEILARGETDRVLAAARTE